MTQIKTLCTLFIVLCLFLSNQTAWGTKHAVILCGSGGEEPYREKFEEWGRRLYDALLKTNGFSPQNIVLFTEAESEAPHHALRSTKENIQAFFHDAHEKITADDILFVFMIGHGSYLQQIAKFHIPGPDITAQDLQQWFDPIPAKQIVLVNAASCSAGFINVLSQQNRILCSATKSVNQINATEFMEFFIEGLEKESADTNFDGRISLLEASHYAASLTEAFYKNQKLIPSETAILDDNADGLGTRLSLSNTETIPLNEKPDGLVADTIFLKEYTFPEDAPKQLLDTYVELLERITQLKKEKESKNRDDYYQQLESLLIQAAKVNRDIHTYE
jgi:hypothetical protein